MRALWCWRCRRVVPMLDEDEWAEVDALLAEGMRAVVAYRRDHRVPLADVPAEALFRPALDAHERITGVRETNHLALYHHRASTYGPPCPACGKPYRTPRAKLCAACGHRREPPDLDAR